MIYRLAVNPFSFLTVIFILFIGCSVPYTATHSYVEYFSNSESHLGPVSFLVLRSGDTVFGKFREPNFTNKIIVNGQTYKKSSVRYMYDHTSVFYRIDKGFGRRIIAGKINVYIRSYYNGKVEYSTVYLQNGDKAEPFEARSFKDYRKLVKDCPLSLEVIDKGTADLKKMRTQHNSFLSTAILLYNRGCVPL